MSFCAEDRVGTPRRIIAAISSFVILFQAIVFAWHHHELSFSSGRTSTVAIAAAPSPVPPASADEDCQICFAISHHGAIPVDLVTAELPDRLPLPHASPAAVFIVVARYPFFHSRAPPLV
ncbi:MAG: hypothetical protein WA633_26790 [Stellaceae bacterium]